jgi:hypothetical protein
MPPMDEGHVSELVPPRHALDQRAVRATQSERNFGGTTGTKPDPGGTYHSGLNSDTP